MTGSLTTRQRWWVAVLHSGPAAALAALSAAEAEGLAGFCSPSVRTVVPHGSDATGLQDAALGLSVVVRQSRGFGEDVVHPARTPRRVLLRHAVIDAASEARSDDSARLLVISSVQQRLVTPARLREAVSGRARLPRRAVISEAVDDVEGGIHWLPELEWTRGLRRYRLPEPVRQQRVRRDDGTWYLDADFQPWDVGVEINGTQHLLVGAAGADDHRRNVLGTGGRLVITLTSHQVRRHRGSAVVATAAALLARGWCPAPSVRRGLESLAAAERMSLLTGDWLPERQDRSPFAV